MKTMREFRTARNLAAVVAFTFGMAACTQSEEPVNTDQAPHTVVNIMAGINGAQTRAIDAAGTGFDEGTEITILDKNNPLKKADFTKGAAEWTSATPLYWDDLTKDSGAETYSFVGIYPKDAGLDYTVGGSELLMAFAENQTSKSKEVKFEFKHVLSKITVTVEPDGTFESVSNPVITLKDIKKSATFKYEHTNNFANFDLTGVAADYPSVDPTVNGTSVNFEFMLPTQTIKDITFTTGTNTYTYSGSIVLAQGKNTTLKLTLTKTGMAPKSVSVDPWGTSDAGEGKLN